MPIAFQVFGPSHLAVLSLCLLTLLSLGWLRRRRPRAAQMAERTLGVLLFSVWPLSLAGNFLAGTLNWQNALPLHLCDIAGLAGGLALWTRRPLACEMVYFFGLAGTLQGLLTPNLSVDFPHPRFFGFFLLHGGVVVTALHVVTALEQPPRPGAVPRLVALTLVYALLIAPVNALLGVNYGFLCEKPARASLMDHLGDWPWYIVSLVLLCGVFYTLLDWPFARQRARR
jgi:hypothetical integral membrane protein (TIGR02206 family)